MTRFSSTSVQLVGFLGLGLLTSGLIFSFNFFHNVRIQGDMKQIAQRDVKALRMIQDTRSSFSTARKEEKNWILFKNPDYLRSREQFLARAQGFLGEGKRLLPDGEAASSLDALGISLMQYASLGRNLEEVQTMKGIEAFTKRAKAIEGDFSQGAETLTDLLMNRVQDRQEATLLSFRDYLWRSILVGFLGIGLFAGAGLLWIRRFRGRIKRLVRAALTISLGDYSPKLQEDSSDELGQLAHYFNQMAEGIAEREAKISRITMELIQANNLLKKGPTPIRQIPMVKF